MEQKTEASQAVDEPFPPMPLPVAKHAVVGDLFDCFAMQQYAMRYADLVVAALKAQPAPTEAMDLLCKLVRSNIGQKTKWQLSDGIGTDTAEGRAWATAIALVEGRPAPTEAAQDESPFKFVPWSKESEMIEGWKKAEKARNEAEGEDGYRLADGYLTGTVVSDPNASWIAIRYQSMEQASAAADLLFSMIDRARAGTETGRVKP